MVIKDFIAPLMDSWLENEWRLEDHNRGSFRLGEAIGNSEYLFYPLDKINWLVLSDSEFILLGEPPVVKARKELKRLMEELGLDRVTSYVPAPAVNYVALLKNIGFKVEGKMRQAGTYNREPVDLIVCGFLPEYKKGRKRRRRSRRVA